MKTILLATVLILAAFASASGADSLGFLFDDGKGNTMPYRLFLPPNHDPDRKYPLVLFLHGLGECGTNNLSQINSNIDGLVAATQSERFASFLLAPQTPNGDLAWLSSWSLSLVDGILQEVQASYRVDERRLYVTGLSMGGFGTLGQLYYYPERYAAGVPIASGFCGDTAKTVAAVIWRIPLWVFHGTLDSVVSVQCSRDIVAAVRAAGGDPLYTEYPDLDHNSWSRAYADAVDQLYPWLFSQSLDNPIARLSLSPESGAAPLEVCFDAGASTAVEGDSLVRFEWDFGDGSTGEGISPCHTYTEPGGYSFRLKVTSELGYSAGASGSVLVHCAPQDAAPWSAGDIGQTYFVGTAGLGDGGRGMSICAGGKPLIGTQDTMHFVHQPISGDITISARVSALEASSIRAQAGVMFRESLDPGARWAAAILRTEGGTPKIRFLYRSAPGAMPKSGPGSISGVQVPAVWMRVARSGEELIGYGSTDGTAWTELGRQTISGFPESCFAGIVATGGDPLGNEIPRPLSAEIADLSLVLPGGLQRPADVNQDGKLDLSDAVWLLEHLFLGTKPALPCEGGAASSPGPGDRALADYNGDGAIDISDPVAALNFLFIGGPPPALGTGCVRIAGCPERCE